MNQEWTEPHEKLAEFLHSIGWKSPCDAQWDQLKAAMLKIHEMSAPVSTDKPADSREAFEKFAEIEYRNANTYTARDFQMGLEGWQAAMASKPSDVQIRNAARYQWLRSPERGMSSLATVVSDDFQPPYFELKCADELDAAIDRAIKTAKGEQQ